MTQPRSTSYHNKLIKDLQNPIAAAYYIKEVKEQGEDKYLAKALKNVIEARGGVDLLSSAALKSWGLIAKQVLKGGSINPKDLYVLLEDLDLRTYFENNDQPT